MSLLKHLTFANQECQCGIRNDELSLKIAIHFANKVYKPDWSKVEISGEFDRGDDLKIILLEKDGSVYDLAEIRPCGANGRLCIEAKEGLDIRDCIARDPGKQVANLLRVMEGLEEDHPIDISVLISDFGRLTVSALPCF